ncbi:hypothetical protein HMPREF2696_02000 [Neisseria sp. HMSC058F07]|uniref:Uncharacterized protein n=1 Tax=Neisseria subflava NJ9703 TaxID=546268 RepID=A0A9W5MY47_NEISU|nr:hypothetical protein NEISUBOT_05624 [Neisseria subflava NJ9703]OFK14794.1 hypothetical protein HMPREF2828_01285 [Neisseria sp. HMSC071A01]OFM32711.1 hypothetical protein HMPREF2696_02000 [Neisseria sp. HMSC058F07]OFN23748.1 hypothetical protein HMPREF2601_00035 [Neisseria sp. HMSC072B12]OFQ12393.1 hypothetical protein HMPREF2952_01960 [Neisseria sp. HMSC068C12]OHQ07416.1 hypothetical protein HMPREF2608_06355 [Neisseria sp. HMSC064D07]
MFLLISVMLYSVDKSSAITVIMQATCQSLGILFKMNYFFKKQERPSERFQTAFDEMILNNCLIE